MFPYVKYFRLTISRIHSIRAIVRVCLLTRSAQFVLMRKPCAVISVFLNKINTLVWGLPSHLPIFTCHFSFDSFPRRSLFELSIISSSDNFVEDNSCHTRWWMSVGFREDLQTCCIDLCSHSTDFPSLTFDRYTWLTNQHAFNKHRRACMFRTV